MKQSQKYIPCKYSHSIWQRWHCRAVREDGLLTQSAQLLLIPAPCYTEKSIWGDTKQVHAVWFHLHQAEKQEPLIGEKNRVFLWAGNDPGGPKREFLESWPCSVLDLGGDRMVAFTSRKYIELFASDVYFSVCLKHFTKKLMKKVVTHGLHGDQKYIFHTQK